MTEIINDLTLGIVDNDPLVASAIQSLLVETRVPIQILWTATSAEQALDTMKTPSQRPQAVLTDIAMPGMTGAELAHHIKKNNIQILPLSVSAPFWIAKTKKDMEHNGLMRFMRLFQKKFPRFNWSEPSEKPLEMMRLPCGQGRA